MADVDDIIDFIKSLKRGFDKDLFQSKIDELAYTVDTSGLEYHDFHTLFKVWLNLTIPITKWVNLGSCLVPRDAVEERTVAYSFRWILANFDNQLNYSRIGFLLDWLTVAMECESIDMKALDAGYEVFYTMLTSEVLTVHAMKLVYTLTKPADVTRRRVLELIDYAKRREGKKNMYRQLQVLLGLFKSYRPDCVPEDIPSVSILTAFKKLNAALINRFNKTKEHRNRQGSHIQHLVWTHQINSDRGRNKKAVPLVPNVEFLNMTSKQHEREPLKTVMDFSDPVSLIQYNLHHATSRPARLRSFLCNATGQILLSMIPHSEQAFLSHDLHHLLNSCFQEVSPYTYIEKQDLLQKLAMFQRTLVQGIPVITRFLAQYLSLWNERDHFAEILELVEWVSVDSPQHIQYIVESLSQVYRRAPPMEQCAILRSLTNMYTNLLYASTKKRQHFLNTLPSPNNYTVVLPALANSIARLCSLGLQIDPDDYRTLYTSIQSSRRCSQAQVNHRAATALPGLLTLALPLLGPSAALIDDMAGLMILYKNIMTLSMKRNEHQTDILTRYIADMVKCLYSEEILSGRDDGLIFEKLDPKLVDKLRSVIPDVDGILSMRNHIAFAPYYIQSLAIDHRDSDNKIFFNAVIEPEFTNLSRFMKQTLPELRSSSNI